MSVASVYTLHSVQRTGIASLVDQIERQSIDSGLTDYLGGGSSSINKQFAALMTAAPILSFTTTRLATALELSGLTGVLATSTNTLIMWFKKRLAGGQYNIGGVHRKTTVSNGLLIPKRLTARHGEIAMLDFELHAISDGAINPIVTAVATLPAAGVGSEFFTVGPIKLDGVTFESVIEVSIDFGIELDKVGANGEINPTFLAIKAMNPVITCTIHDLSHATDNGGTPALPVAGTAALFGSQGGIASGAGLTVFLRKKSADGTGNLLNATAEHIAITAADLRYVWETMEAADQDDATLRLKFTPIDSSGSGATMVVATESAIT